MLRFGMVLVSGLALSAPGALAAGEDCARAVEALAQRYQLSADAPSQRELAESREPLGEKLAESGGVIRPPPVDGGKVIEPPRTGDPMPTVRPPRSPEIPPEAQISGAQARAGGLLQAARKAAEEGDEASCRARLAEAAQQLAEAPE